MNPDVTKWTSMSERRDNFAMLEDLWNIIFNYEIHVMPDIFRRAQLPFAALLERKGVP